MDSLYTYRYIREGRSILREPLCPFCGCFFERPQEIEIDIEFVLGGRCECGAIYVCDPSGRNLGEVYMNALLMLSGGDWDKASSLDADVDFEERTLNYDPKAHRLVRSSTGLLQRMYNGKIIFLRMRSRIHKSD